MKNVYDLKNIVAFKWPNVVNYSSTMPIINKFTRHYLPIVKLYNLMFDTHLGVKLMQGDVT